MSEAGLRMMGLPQARAGATFQLAISSGKFHGTIRAQTPDRLAQDDVQAGVLVGMVTPRCLLAAPA